MPHPSHTEAPSHRTARASFRPVTSSSPSRADIAISSPRTVTPTVARPRVVKQLRRFKARTPADERAIVGRDKKKLTRELPHPVVSRRVSKLEYSDAYSTLQPFVMKDGSIDLHEAYSSDISRNKLDAASLALFEGITQEDLSYYGREPLLQEDYAKLSDKQQDLFYPTSGVTFGQYKEKIAGIMNEQPGDISLATDEDYLKYFKNEDVYKEMRDYSVVPAGVTASEYAKLSTEDKQYHYPELSVWESLTPWKEEEGGKWSAAGIGVMGAELLIPFVYTSRHAKELGTGWTAGGIALDLASLIPIVGMGVRGTAAGVRVGLTTKRAMMNVALSQIKAPYTMVRHPLSTLKVIPQTIKETTRVFYAPYEAVMQSRKGMASFWSDLRLVSGKGFEAPAETLRAMQELGAVSIAGTTATHRAGIQAVQLDPVAFVRVSKYPTACTSSPVSQKFLQAAAKDGWVKPSPEIYAASGGTGFVEQSAHGGGGPMSAFNWIDIPGGVKDYPEWALNILR